MKSIPKSTLNTLAIASFITILLFTSCNKNEEPEQEIDLTNCDCGCDEKFGSFIDGRDGHEYKTIQIGEQTWMAENLAYLPEVFPLSDSYTKDANTVKSPRFFVYNYYGTNVKKAKSTNEYKVYGVYYTVWAAIKSCPSGWHLPSNDEWNQLESYLIHNDYCYSGDTVGNGIGKALAATCVWLESDYKGDVGFDLTSNNSSCFSALPAGECSTGYSFHFDEHWAKWWTDTSEDGKPSWYLARELDYSKGFLSVDGERGYDGYSVRCVKD